MSDKINKPVVMHFIAAMDVAGSARVVLNLLSQKEYMPYDMRVTSFVRSSDGTGNEFLDIVHKNGIISDKIMMYKRWDWGDVRAFTQIIKKHNVKLIHSHGYKSDIVGALASMKTGIPMIITAHGFTASDLKLAIYEKIGCLFMQLAKKIICVSENVRNTVRKMGIRSNKILVIPNAVDFEYFSRPAEIDFRNEWRISPNELLIGTAGRLSSEKAQADLVKAFALIPEDIRGRCRMVIAGNGPERDSLLSLAADLKLGDKLILPGFIRDMRSFYKAIDIFCLPSLTEGSPLTVLEAAASGKPIVATEVGSLKALINDGDDGLLVAPGNTDELSTCLNKLIISPEIRKSMAKQLNNKLKADYNIEAWARKIFSTYEDILDK